MKLIKTASTIALAALITTTSAFAGEIGKREAEQQKRIAQGIANGSLTPYEVARLEQQQVAIRAEYRLDKIDGGGLSAHEKVKINRQLNATSRNIHRQKND